MAGCQRSRKTAAILSGSVRGTLILPRHSIVYASRSTCDRSKDTLLCDKDQWASTAVAKRRRMCCGEGNEYANANRNHASSSGNRQRCRCRRVHSRGQWHSLALPACRQRSGAAAGSRLHGLLVLVALCHGGTGAALLGVRGGPARLRVLGAQRIIAGHPGQRCRRPAEFHGLPGHRAVRCAGYFAWWWADDRSGRTDGGAWHAPSHSAVGVVGPSQPVVEARLVAHAHDGNSSGTNLRGGPGFTIAIHTAAIFCPTVRRSREYPSRQFSGLPGGTRTGGQLRAFVEHHTLLGGGPQARRNP